MPVRVEWADEFMRRSDREVVESFIEAGLRGDTETITELTHPQCEITVPPSLPYGGTYEAEEAFLDVWARVFAVWETFDIELEALLVDDDRALAVYDTWLVAKDAESGIEMPIVELYRIESDQIIEVRSFYQDTHRTLAELE
jgi:ketosteroid isomerase-like protein